jgi:hypothetical protein
MHARRFLLTGLALGCALLAPRLRATTVEPPSFETLVTQSDYVVRAVVKTATAEWKDGGGKPYISTRLELDVREVIKGTPPSPLVLEVLGGKIGEIEFTVTGMPGFQVGDDSILFVYGAEKKLYPFVAMMHGIYPVLHETKSGQDYMLRANGMPLYSTADVALPMERPNAALKQGSAIRPLTPKAFIQEIRQRAARQTNYREN